MSRQDVDVQRPVIALGKFAFLRERFGVTVRDPLPVRLQPKHLGDT
jgi:hypothetical protein